MGNQHILTQMKPGQRLEIEFPCGLSLDEGTGKAKEWWNEIGRIILKQAWEQAETANDGDISKNDGIHRGLLFDQLNTREKHKVLMSWYVETWCVENGLVEIRMRILGSANVH